MIQDRIEIRNKLVSSLKSIGALAGCNNIGIADGIEGLGMSIEQYRCNELSKTVEEGLFKIVVMGSFVVGKSTIINAMLGSEVLQVSQLPITAILTSVQYGDDNDDSVDVYMVDEILNDGSVRKGKCVKMSLEDFNKEFRYTIEDEIAIRDTGRVLRFDKVKYAVIHSSSPTLEGSVTFLDTPGIEDRDATEKILGILDQAQAIIYVVKDRGFCMMDRDLIECIFGSCPRNVFFLINKFDRVFS